MSTPREDQDRADVERVLAGDTDAFEGIVRRWQGPLVNLAWRFCRDKRRAEEMAQEAFDRWWAPCLMFFGPPDKDSTKTGPFMQWRIKTATNDTLRQAYVNRFAPAAKAIGLKIHVARKDSDGLIARKPDGTPDMVEDPLCSRDEKTGDWGFTQPDWDEFYRVIGGDGPCNRRQRALRRMSYEQGRWVRKAVMGYVGLPPSKN